MPLTDVVRYLNEKDRVQRPDSVLEDPFYATVRGAVARYARITLDSDFAAIYRPGHRLYGHAGVLNARGELNDLLMHPEAIFAIPGSNSEFVHLDRLVRTLHALNYLIHPEAERLLVKVNLRHIESVAGGHGEAFEDTLRACGLEPRQITLEVAITNDPQPFLRKAVAAYRERGYGIAIARHGFDWTDLAWIAALRPDIVRLDGHLLQSRSPLANLAARLRDAGVASLIAISAGDGEIARIQSERAVDAGVTLVQYPLGEEGYLDRAVRLQEVDRNLAAPG